MLFIILVALMLCYVNPLPVIQEESDQYFGKQLFIFKSKCFFLKIFLKYFFFSDEQIKDLLNIIQGEENKDAKVLLMNSSPIFKKFLSTENITINNMDDLVNHYIGKIEGKERGSSLVSNKHLTWKLYRGSNRIGDLVFWETIKTAFDLWSSITDNQFIYSPNQETDFNIGFLPQNHATSSNVACVPFGAGELAHAFFPETHYAGEVHFNENQVFFREKNQYSFSLLHTAVHEIGHSLGLRHNERTGSIMYPSTGPNKHLVLDLNFFDIYDRTQFRS